MNDVAAEIDVQSSRPKDFGHQLCRAWAEHFDRLHGEVRDADRLRELHRAELAAQAEIPLGRVRRAMALLEFDTYVTVLIHHRSPEIAQLKVKEVAAVVGHDMSRRNYWDRLALGTYFAAGLVALGEYLPRN